jgi:hypothetical protein
VVIEDLDLPNPACSRCYCRASHRTIGVTYTVMAIRMMGIMGKQISIDLTAREASMMRKPVRGQGGFQSLMRKLQHQLEDRHLDVSRDDVERLRRYAAAYGSGGFQHRIKSVIS